MAPLALKASSSSAKKRKPTQQQAEDSDSDGPEAQETLIGNLELDSDGEEHDNDDEVEDQGEDGEEVFPEIDVASSDEEEEDEKQQAGDEDEYSADSELDEDEEEDGSESGYNSSDIDQMNDSPPPSRPPSTTDRKIDKFIAQNTVKPDERDASIILKQEDPLEGRYVTSELTGRPKKVYREIDAGYGSDSSTEDHPNTVGDIPSHWYDDMPHIGYDVNGKKIMRPAQGDELDKFLATVEDPDSWTSVQDKLLSKNTQLTDAELDLIRRLQAGENPDGAFDPYQPTNQWFTNQVEEMPISSRPEPKSRFVPSKWEHKKIMKIVRAIRQGRIVPNKPTVSKPPFYALWSADDMERAPHAMHMPAPKPRLPTTAESYNPPEEYLLDEKEQEEYNNTEKEDRKVNYVPKKHDALRGVGGYENFVQERFERCLDLYLAPRVRKTRLNIDPESLLPKLPSPRELKPFPTVTGLKLSHAGQRVRCVSFSPDGNWLATGSEDGKVRCFDVAIGRESWCLDLKKGVVFGVEWCPNKDLGVFAVTVENAIYLISPHQILQSHTSSLTSSTVLAASSSSSASTSATISSESIKWNRGTEAERSKGILVVIDVPGTPKQVTWHRKGDYFSTVATDGGNKSVLIHQVSKHQTQSPFKKTKGSVQKVAFHPTKPHFFVVTQRYIRLYDLAAQSLLKTLMPGLKWLSSVDIHPMGDNLIVGSYDKKLCWFDLDLSTKPFKTLRYHAKALRSVSYHRQYPLFCSSSDDGTINIFHGTVYSDLMQNPLIVPLKVLKGHAVAGGLGVLEVKWHPNLPWLASAGADGDVRIWCP